MNGFTANKMNLCVDMAATTAVYTHKVLGKIQLISSLINQPINWLVITLCFPSFTKLQIFGVAVKDFKSSDGHAKHDDMKMSHWRLMCHIGLIVIEVLISCFYMWIFHILL